MHVFVADACRRCCVRIPAARSGWPARCRASGSSARRPRSASSARPPATPEDVQTSVPGGQFTSALGYVGNSAACAGFIRFEKELALLQTVVVGHLRGVHGGNRHVEHAGTAANHQTWCSSERIGEAQPRREVVEVASEPCPTARTADCSPAFRARTFAGRSAARRSG